MKLGQAFDPRHNALNAWRLGLAVCVILWHSVPLTGHAIGYEPLVRLLSEAFVDGFFTISGFLITASWMRRPRLREFWVARVLRIFPGLWICLLVTAFVIAPLAAAIEHRSLRLSSEVGYVLSNAVMYPYNVGIDGTPANVPWAGVWNGSLWTLLFEMLCYIAVAVLGVTGLLKRRWTIPVLFVLAVAWSAWVSYPTIAMQTIPQILSRFAVVFLAGALLHQFRDRVPARWSLVALCVAVVLVSALMQNYRVVAALPLAYAIVVSGALIRRVELRNDFSYGMYIYAYPVQQLLLISGLKDLNPLLFFVIAATATVPLAALSWFLVERHAMSLKRRIERRSSRKTVAVA